MGDSGPKDVHREPGASTSCLVIGATGSQGGSVVRALTGAGFAVRAMTRRPTSPAAAALRGLGAVVCAGDLNAPASLSEAFEGAGTVFIVLDYWRIGADEEARQAETVIAAAKRAGVHHAVLSTGFGVDVDVAANRGKQRAEALLLASGIPCSIVRPALFMEDLEGRSLPLPEPVRGLVRRDPRRAGRLLLAIMAALNGQDADVPLVAMEDIGRAVLWLLQNPAARTSDTWSLVGDVVRMGDLIERWERSGRGRVRSWPGLVQGLRLVRADLAELLAVLPRAVESAPLPLIKFQSFAAFLERSGPSAPGHR